jgi:hypothetical protein
MRFLVWFLTLLIERQAAKYERPGTMKKALWGVLLFVACAVIAIAQVPTNCSTATGYPCSKNTWEVVSCSPTITNNGPGGSQDSGPCIAAMLRCVGTAATCSASSLPVQTGAAPQAFVGNATWKVVTSTFGQTSPAGGPYYDNSGLLYNATYWYAVAVEYSGAGGGLWSAYSAPFQISFGAAPQAPLGTPATPAQGVSAVQ